MLFSRKSLAIFRKSEGMPASIDVHPLFEDSAAEIGIAETTNREQINLTPQRIFEMMEQSEESLRGVPIRLLELNEQINIASSSLLTACKRPKKIPAS